MGPREGMHILSPWPAAFSQRSGFCKKSDFSRRTTLKKKEQVRAERARQVGAPLALVWRKGRENPSPLAAGVADFSSEGCTSEEEVTFRACVWGWTEQVSPGGPQGGAAGRESPAFSFAGTEGRGGGGRWKTQLFRGLVSAPIPGGSSQQTQLLCSRAREMGGGGTQPSLSWGFRKDRCPVGTVWASPGKTATRTARGPWWPFGDNGKERKRGGDKAGSALQRCPGGTAGHIGLGVLTLCLSGGRRFSPQARPHLKQGGNTHLVRGRASPGEGQLCPGPGEGFLP